MKNLYPGDYRTANSIDPHTKPMGIAAGISGAFLLLWVALFNSLILISLFTWRFFGNYILINVFT